VRGLELPRAVEIKKTLTLPLSLQGRGDPHATVYSTYSITQTKDSQNTTIGSDGSKKSVTFVRFVINSKSHSSTSFRRERGTIMKLKNLRKKIRRLEKRLQEGPKKLARLKQRLQAAEAAKAMKAARKSAARATAARPAVQKPSSVKKPKKKLNLSPERRAQLSAEMKARWAAKRAAEANAKSDSADQDSAQRPPPQPPENRPDGA
jgi:hypothetical protein